VMGERVEQRSMSVPANLGPSGWHNFQESSVDVGRANDMSFVADVLLPALPAGAAASQSSGRWYYLHPLVPPERPKTAAPAKPPLYAPARAKMEHSPIRLPDTAASTPPSQRAEALETELKRLRGAVSQSLKRTDLWQSAANRAHAMAEEAERGREQAERGKEEAEARVRQLEATVANLQRELEASKASEVMAKPAARETDAAAQRCAVIIPHDEASATARLTITLT